MVDVNKMVTLMTTLEIGLTDVDCELEYRDSLYTLTGFNKYTNTVEFMMNRMTKDQMKTFIEFLQKGLEE